MRIIKIIFQFPYNQKAPFGNFCRKVLKSVRLSTLLGLLWMPMVVAYEYEAPVADLSGTPTEEEESASPVSQPISQNEPYDSSTPLTQRVVRLERQLDNFAQMNMPQQIVQMQQQIAQLNGQLQEQSHQIKVLIDQNHQLQMHAEEGIRTQPAVAVNETEDQPPRTNEEASAYQAGVDQFAKKQYQLAENAFLRYLTDYPKGKYLADVHYWLGEIYFSRHHWAPAAEQFQIVLDQFKSSSKVTDARLKLAMIHQIRGQKDKARKEFQSLIQEHPGTPTAELAKIQLQLSSGI